MGKSWYIDLNTALYEAVHLNKEEDIDDLLKAGANPSAMSRLSISQLEFANSLWVFRPIAIIFGQITHFLGMKFSDDNEAGTSLNLAIKMRLKGIILDFIKHGKTDINQANHNGWTALHFACLNGYLNSVEDILSKRGEINSKTNDGDTPLHIAIRKRNEELAKVLLKNGANVNEPNAKGDTAMHVLARSEDGRNINILLLLFRAGANPKLVNKKGHMPSDIDHWLIDDAVIIYVMRIVFIKKDYDAVKRMVKYYPLLINRVMKVSLERKNLSLFKHCVKINTNLNVLDEKGEALIHKSANNTDSRFMEELIKAGAEVNVLDSKEMSVLDHLIEKKAMYGKLRHLDKKILLLLNAGVRIEADKKWALPYVQQDIKRNNLEGVITIMTNYPQLKSSKTLLAYAAEVNPVIAVYLINSVMDVESFLKWDGASVISNLTNILNPQTPEEQLKNQKRILAKKYGILSNYEVVKESNGRNTEYKAALFGNAGSYIDDVRRG